MSYLAGKLKHKISIMQGIDTPSDDGSFRRTYQKLVSLWSWKKQLGTYISIIRSQALDEGNKISTDEFGVRYDSIVSRFYRTFTSGFGNGFDSLQIDKLGRAFDGGFDNGFESLVDIYPIKSDYFIFLQTGNSDAYRGRLYKINNIILDDNTKEFAILQCSLQEEQGLGAEIVAN